LICFGVKTINMLTNKVFLWSQTLVLLMSSAAFVFPSIAGTIASLESGNSSEPSIADELDEVNDGLQKTLEYNFSPVDRALLRKALTDYARNNDPEHIKIKRQRQLMRDSLRERFAQCNKDLDDSLDRQEVTECLPQIARHFNAVDIDENNVITFDELELAQAKWRERHKAAEAKLELQRIKEAEAEIKSKAAQPKESKQAATAGQHPS
jgi:Ca2+-binding EF-hand superfamily protein